jgi:hypothetical protein
MIEHPTPPTPAETLAAGHEPDRVNARGVAIVGLVLGTVVAAALFGLSLLHQRLKPQRESERPASRRPTAWQRGEQPPIDFNQPAQLKALREWENRELHTYGWRDEEMTAARVPIERAMQILVEHGDPFAGVREGPKGEAQQPPDEPANPETQPGADDAEKTDGTES